MKNIDEMTVDEMEKELQDYINEKYIKTKRYIFISYSHRDKEKVYKQILSWIREGYNVFLDLDFKNRGSDENWIQLMRSKLRDNMCSLAVIFRSEDYYFSLPSFVELLTMRSEETTKSRRRADNKILPIDVIKISEVNNNGRDFSSSKLESYYEEEYTKKLKKSSEFMGGNPMEKDLFIEGLKSFETKIKSNPEYAEDTWETILDDIKNEYSNGYTNYYPCIASYMIAFFTVNNLNGNYKTLKDDERSRFKELDIYNRNQQSNAEKPTSSSSLTTSSSVPVVPVPTVTSDLVSVKPDIKPEIKPEIKPDVNIEETKANEPDLKIGALVRTTLRRYLEEGNVSAEEIEALGELEYSKNVLHLNFPLLVKKGSDYDSRRYYADPVNINGAEYMICSQWYETLAHNDRPYLEKWIKDHENGPIPVSKETVVLEGEDTGKKTKNPSVNCPYTIYGKYYPDDSQAIMMINVFAKVLNKHTDLIPQLIPLLNCLSDKNYEDNKPTDMPSYFRVCKYFPIGSGVCVGAAYSLLDKLKLIARLLVYCKEPIDIFTIEDTEVQAEFVKWYEKYKANSEKASSEGGELKPVHKAGDLTYTIYGKEYTGNQTNMMVDAINAIIVKHFDKLQEIVKQLTSVEYGELSTLKAKGISYFRTGESFTYQGITYSIGTSYGIDAKLGQIEKAIKICNEDPENFDLEGLEIKEDHKSNSGSAKRSTVKQRDFLND